MSSLWTLIIISKILGAYWVFKIEKKNKKEKKRKIKLNVNLLVLVASARHITSEMLLFKPPYVCVYLLVHTYVYI